MKASWTANLVLKVISLLVAVLVWNFYRTEPTSIRVMTIPIEFLGTPQELELTGTVAQEITVRVEAPEATIRSLTPDRIHARVDLSHLGLGQQFIPITAGNLEIPIGVKVLHLDPDIVSLTVERKLRRAVPIEPVVEGEPAPGYELSRIVLSPPRILIEGPEQEVRKSEKGLTDSIHLSGRSETFQRIVSVVPDLGSVRVSGDRSAIATVEIREIPQERGFLRVPVEVENAATAATVEPLTLGVTVLGPPSKLNGLTRSHLRALVDATGLSPRQEPYELAPRVVFIPASLGAVLEVTGTSRETVSVRLADK